MHNIALYCNLQKYRHVCVVGDDAQSIYSFRGADINNILKFQVYIRMPACLSWNTDHCQGGKQSYRREQIRKEVFSENDKGEPITVFNAYSDVEKGEIVA